MKNQTWISKLWAIAYIAPYDFVCPIIPANPTVADYETAINAIETAVANSTSPISFQKRVHLMIEMADLSSEFTDKKSVDLACGDQYCITNKIKKTVKLSVFNTTDPYINQLLTGTKATEDVANGIFYSHDKVECKPLTNMVVKVVSCPDAEGNVNTYYYMPTTLEGTILTKYQDYCKNEFEWSELTFELSSGGCAIQKVSTFNKALNDDLASN